MLVASVTVATMMVVVMMMMAPTAADRDADARQIYPYTTPAAMTVMAMPAPVPADLLHG